MQLQATVKRVGDALSRVRDERFRRLETGLAVLCASSPILMIVFDGCRNGLLGNLQHLQACVSTGLLRQLLRDQSKVRRYCDHGTFNRPLELLFCKRFEVFENLRRHLHWRQ